MSDLKTALQQALLTKEINDWDKEEQQRMNPTKPTNAPKMGFTVTNNVSRECFASVKNHPGLTSVQHNEMLTKRGFKTSSTTSILAQLVKTGQVRKDENRRLYAIVPEYQPLKPTKPATPKAVAEKIVEVGNTHQSSAGIAALPADGKKKAAWSPEQVVQTLNVMQARQLYDTLKQIFGG